MSQKAYNTITLRRLPSGETVQIALSANRSLTILVNKGSRQQSPVLSDKTTIEITPRVYSTTGNNAVSLTNIHWYMNDTDVGPNLGSIARVDGITGKLTIYKSPIDVVVPDNNLAPITLKFSATAEISGHKYAVEKQTSLDFPEVSENSYWGSISASNGTTLDADHASTTLTPELYLNTGTVSDYKVKWYKTGAGEGGKDLEITESVSGKWTLTGKELTVYRDGVDSAAHFECHFFTDSDAEVEAEGVSIVDLTDNIQVILEGETYIAENAAATINIRAVNTKDQTDYSIADGGVSVVVTDSLRQRTYNPAHYSVEVSGGQGVFMMNEKYWRVPYGDQQTEGHFAICNMETGVDYDAYVGGLKQGSTTETYTDLAEVLAAATKCEVILLVGVTVNI